MYSRTAQPHSLLSKVSQNLILESAKAVAAAAAATVAAAVAGVEGQAVPVATRQEVHGTARAQASAAAKVRRACVQVPLARARVD